MRILHLKPTLPIQTTAVDRFVRIVLTDSDGAVLPDLDGIVTRQLSRRHHDTELILKYVHDHVRGVIPGLVLALELYPMVYG